LQWQHVDISTPLDKKEFAATLHRYPLVVVNFYAPWCPFCRRMEPSWEAATQAVHDKYPEESDGRIRFAKVGVPVLGRGAHNSMKCQGLVLAG
jgi:thiol-disulfide isomerase/thioredoxin